MHNTLKATVAVNDQCRTIRDTTRARSKNAECNTDEEPEQNADRYLTGCMTAHLFDRFKLHAILLRELPTKAIERLRLQSG